ncbi:hypothetical protein CRUP_038191 [Coryphaenoides rupestris]|nr:hypothetical protein CRUP_038191 [Coryphaenoides rupestris]
MNKLECLECSEDGDADGADDSADEFSRPVPWKKVDAEGLDCDYALLFTKDEANRLFNDWRPRCCNSTGLHYTYSGVKHGARQWTPTLEYIRDSVTKINRSGLLLPPDTKTGRITWASTETMSGNWTPLPDRLRLPGSRRDFVFRHRDVVRGRAGQRRRIEPVKLQLASGSLLLMNPPTNTYWYHSLPRRRAVLQPRINLTFRRILTSGGEGGF